MLLFARCLDNHFMIVITHVFLDAGLGTDLH
jgi:hypothetical protein